MPKVNWQSLPGRIVASTYELHHLIRASEDSAEFTARDLRNGTEVEIAFSPSGAGVPGPALAALDHENLRRVLGTGTEDLDSLRRDYVVTEGAERLLLQDTQEGPLPPDRVGEIASDILRGLRYLHSRGFVYMNLRPESIVHIGGAWKLAEPEFAQPAGQVNPDKTRPLLGRSPYAPPEAFNGVIAPTWDVWSFGMLLKRLLVPNTDRTVAGQRRASSANAAPPPFDSIIHDCLQPDPLERASLQRIAEMLGGPTATDPATPDVAGATEPRPARRVRSYAAGQEGGKRRVRTYTVPAAEIARPAESRIPAGEPMLDVTATGVGDHAIYDNELERDVAPQPYTTAYDRHPAIDYGDVAHRPHPLRTRMAVAVAGLVLGAVLYMVIWRPAPGGVGAGQGELTKNRAAAPGRVLQPAEPSPVPDVSSSGSAAREAVDPKAREQAIRSMLANWVDSTRKLDLDRHILSYAPRVEQFFRRRNLTREEVKNEKKQAFAQIGEVRKLDISNVKIEFPKPERAVVLLRKEWDFVGKRPFAGAETERLTLGWINGRWQITSEQERKVEWTRHSGSRARAEGEL